MHRNQRHRRTYDGQVGLSIESSGKTLGIGSIARATLARACRYPFATLFGIGVTTMAHLAVVTLAPENAGLLGLTIIELFAGTALFLFLSTFMVLRPGRLNHVGSLFRSGAIVSLCVTMTAAVPMIISLVVLPSDWLDLPQWQFLRDSWPIVCLGFGVVGLATVLPAFLVAWPIHASVGLPLSKSVLFVWREIEGESYSSTRMNFFVALVGWLLLTLPGAGLLVPVLYAHLTTVLFNELVVSNS